MPLNPGQIKIVWDAGTIDGAFCWGSVMQHIIDNSGSMLISARQLGVWGKETFNVVSVRSDFAKKHAQLVRHVVDVMNLLTNDYLDTTSYYWNPADKTLFEKSVADVCFKNSSNLAVRKDTSDALANFVFVDQASQFSCDYLAIDRGCSTKTGTGKDSLETSEFLWEQKLVYSLVPASRYASTESAYTEFMKRCDGTYIDAAVSLSANSLASLLADTGSLATPTKAGSLGGDSNCSGVTWVIGSSSSKGTLTDGAGGVSTASYSESLACTWVIEAENSTKIVEVNFTDFRVWAGDLVNVYKGTDTTVTLLAQLSGVDRTWPPYHAKGCRLQERGMAACSTTAGGCSLPHTRTRTQHNHYSHATNTIPSACPPNPEKISQNLDTYTGSIGSLATLPVLSKFYHT
mmetsp:Transcript_8881/g.16012  ORF Transcript_8881/g.16012 Transcript_8881/m.16012 type:complete len:403 (-) Transcript_8881:255-1463(-)